MLSPTLLRRNPDAVAAGLRRRHAGQAAEAALSRWLELDRVRREVVMAGDGQAADEIEATMRTAMLVLPNLPARNVPDASLSDNPVIVRTWGTPGPSTGGHRHEVIGQQLGILDLPAAAHLAGARFSLLFGEGARLVRVLTAYLLEIHAQHGYVEVAPPHLLRGETLLGSGHLPAHADEMYRVERDDLYLSPTGEAQLVGLIAGKLLSERELPLAYTAATPCFRREAGAAGARAHGLIRQHQFDKVELVRIVREDDADETFERMVAEVEHILVTLGLVHRVVALRADDLPFAAERTWDIEVWLAGEQRYVEISSISVCGTFQSRRLNARYRPMGGRTNKHPVTLNASALPLGRTLAALLEAGEQRNGTVRLPVLLASKFGSSVLAPAR